jgi:hypothetical protein
MSWIATDLSFSPQNSLSVVRFPTGSGLTSQPSRFAASARGFGPVTKAIAGLPGSAVPLSGPRVCSLGVAAWGQFQQ